MMQEWLGAQIPSEAVLRISRTSCHQPQLPNMSLGTIINNFAAASSELHYKASQQISRRRRGILAVVPDARLLRWNRFVGDNTYACVPVMCRRHFHLSEFQAAESRNRHALTRFHKIFFPDLFLSGISSLCGLIKI